MHTQEVALEGGQRCGGIRREFELILCWLKAEFDTLVQPLPTLVQDEVAHTRGVRTKALAGVVGLASDLLVRLDPRIHEPPSIPHRERLTLPLPGDGNDVSGTRIARL